MKGKVVLHADLNNFFASVSCLTHPHLREIPLAVCGDPAMRHGIVVAKNMVAKRMGVKTGQVIWQARQLCPHLQTVSPDLESILEYSRKVRAIFTRYTDRVQPFGLDEAWLDVSEAGMTMDRGVKVANHLRHVVREETGLTVSVGVSDNRVFAKLGSDLKKPDAVSVISPDNRQTVMDPLPVNELVFVGPSTTRKLNSVGIYTIGQLAAADPGMLKALLGQTGLMLSGFAHGDDSADLVQASSVSPIKSVSNSITTAHDIVTKEDARITLYGLCESVASRMRAQGVVGQTLKLSVRDTNMQTFQRQCRMEFCSDSSFDLFHSAYQLLLQNWTEGQPVRALGVGVSALSPADAALQLSFLPGEAQRQKRKLLECAVDDIRKKYGHFAIQRAIMLSDRPLGEMDPEREHVLTPGSCFP